MSVTRDLATWMANNGYGVVGDNITISQMADKPDSQIAVVMYDSGGGTEALSMSTHLQAIQPRIQVQVREKRYQPAEDKTFELFKALIAVNSVALPPSNEFYEWINPTSAPALFERDKQERVTFVFNLTIVKKNV